MPSSTKRPASSPTVPSFPTSTFSRDEGAAASQRAPIHDIFANDVSSPRSTRTQQERLSLSRAKTRSREEIPKRTSSVPTTPRKPPPTLESLERMHSISLSKMSSSNRVADGSRIPSSSIPRASAMASTSSPSRAHRHISVSSPRQASNDHPRVTSTSIPVPAPPPRTPSRGPSASSRPSTSTFGSQSVNLDQRRRAASSSASPSTGISKKSSYQSFGRPMPPPHSSPSVSSLPASSSSPVNGASGAGGAYTPLKSSIPISASPVSASPLSSSSVSPSSPYAPMRSANPSTRSMSAPRPYRPAPLSLSATTTVLPSSSPYGGYVSDSGIPSDDGNASDAGISGGGGTPLAVDMKRLWSKPAKSGSGGGSSSIISNSSEASSGSISLSSAVAATGGAQLQQTRPRRVSSPMLDNSSGPRGAGKNGAVGGNVPSPLASASSGSTARKSSIPVRPVTADNATTTSNYTGSSLLSFPRTTLGLGGATAPATTTGIPSVSRKPKPAALNLPEQQHEKPRAVAYNTHQQQPGPTAVTSTSRAPVAASPTPPPLPRTSSPSARQKDGSAPRQRNVLRRKSSRLASAAAGVKSPSATPTAASFQPVTPSKTGSSSAPSSDSGHGNDSRSGEKSALTPARALAEAYKQQERRRMELETMSSASSSVSSSPLPSPGGTGQKQKQREYPSSSSLPAALTDSGGDMLSSSPPSASEALPQPSRTNGTIGEAQNAARTEDEAEDEESKQREREPMPYYTVLGSSTGHLVAVGGPEDDMWNLNLDAIWSPDEQRKAIRASAAATSAANGGGVGKMLTRKVSARWRRTTTGGEVLTEEGGGGGGGGGSGGSHSGKKSFDSKVAAMAARGKKQSDPMPDRWADDLWGRPSMQAALEERERGRPSTTISSGAQPSGESATGVPNVGRKVKEEEERKGKIWRLMKRLSTGGLRDKYHAFDEPPPVPALPKQYDKSNGSGGNGDSVTASATTVPSPSGSSSPNGLFSRFMQSRPPSSPAAGATTPQVSSPTFVEKPSPPPKIQTAMGRPSTTTRSSSPVSSDVASSKFFQPPRSNRSSSSSYGEEMLPPPLPKPNSNAQSTSSTPLGKYIVPPSELNAMQTPLSSSPPGQHWSASSPSSQGSRSPRTQQTRRTASQPAWLVQPSSEDAPPSLPLPPRRPATKRSSSSSLTFQQQQQQREILSYTPNGMGSTNSKQKSRSSSARGRQEISFPSSSSSEGHASLVSLPSQLTVPPPRPRKSSRRSYAPQILSSPPSSEAIAVNAQQQQFLDSDDMGNDNIRDMTWAEFGGRPVGKSHNTTLSTSTVRQYTRDRSISPPIASPSLDGHRDGRARTMPPPKKTMMVFRSLSRDDSPRKVMSEKEKADRWDDLLQMSERAGGTLHLGTGQELLSDQMSIISNSRFSRIEETFR